jgi:Macrocin-O-methyltransferase (TylF)
MAITENPDQRGTPVITAWSPPADAGPTIVRGVNLEHLSVDRALTQLYQPSRAKTIFPRGAKAEVYAVAARTIGSCPLTYLEFGVHSGTSMHQISTLFRDPGATFVGFDSFEGLPEEWGTFKPGQFSTGGTAPSLADSRVSFVKGWFQNSVPGFFQANKLNGPMLVHFDADLYSSTLFLMTTLWHHVPDYYFLFDEFVPSEIVAMYDFARSYPVAFEFTACTVDERDRPIQIFGRLRNTVYQPALPG